MENKIKELEEKLLRKEQECEELKEKCRKYGEINEQETKDYAELKNKAEKYKQTLTEIKEIIEQGVKIHDDIIVSKQILQKISDLATK